MSSSHEHTSINTVFNVQSQLFAAVEQNDRSQLMAQILSSHCDPRLVRNEQQETLLHIASKLGLIDMVRTLVEIYQLCPFEVDQFSCTSCHRACQYKHLHILSYFFRLGGHYTYISDFQPPHTGGQSPHSLIPVDFALHMLSAAVLSESVVMTRFTYTLLCYSQVECLFKVKLNLFLDVFYVLQKIIDPELRLHNGADHFEFIASCCRGGCKLDVLKVVLDELVNISHYTFHGQAKEQVRSIYASLLEAAYRLDNPDIADYLIKRKGVSPAQEPSVNCYQLILLQPFVHSHCFRHSYSPLYTAVQSGNISIVRRLTASTTDFYHLRNHLSTDHGTLLHSACVSGSKEMVRIMIQELDCDINAQNKHGDTPLHVASEWGWLEIVQYLFEQRGCDVNVLNDNGYSPFTLAIKHNRIDIFNFLLIKHVNINTQTADTLETPLHLACYSNSIEFAIALLNDGCYTCALNSVDKYGDTPYLSTELSAHV